MTRKTIGNPVYTEEEESIELIEHARPGRYEINGAYRIIPISEK